MGHLTKKGRHEVWGVGKIEWIWEDLIGVGYDSTTLHEILKEIKIFIK